MNDNQDIFLPKLSPLLKITKAPPVEGEPYWTLHHPILNIYHKIDWLTYECLLRFSISKTAKELKEKIETETPLRINVIQIIQIIDFLAKNHLIAEGQLEIPFQEKKKELFLKKLLHRYLYFTIPLFRPQKFLDQSYKHVSFFFRPLFYKSMLILLGLLLVATLFRIDEFLNTFIRLLSIEGAIATFLTFTCIKIIHELAHAYAAVRNGVKVPHMGVAFIVMYPILYTETTGSWELESRRGRIEIGLAGIIAELCLACIFLIGWHILPPDSLLQSLCFLVVAVSLIGSLAINLNPLMKFDGYYVFSDLVGVDNLQHRSCQFAKWKLRSILFGWTDPPPESLPSAKIRFLVGFGAALIIYRFFVFLGIALLVYHLFFQPLGLFLMCVELVWFIGIPIWNELKIWWTTRNKIIETGRGKFVLALTAIFLIFLIVPWKTEITLPAVMHSESMQSFYAPSGAKIQSIMVHEGQSVKSGDVLMVLSSPDLEKEIQIAQQNLSRLESLRRQAASDPALRLDSAIAPEKIENARVKLQTLEKKQQGLVLKASQDGVIRDFDDNLRRTDFIPAGLFLMHVIAQGKQSISAYATEDVLQNLSEGLDAEFIPRTHPGQRLSADITMVSQTAEKPLRWTELSSLYGGMIAADSGPEGEAIPRRSAYAVSLTPDVKLIENTDQIVLGHVRVKTRPESILFNYIKRLNIRSEIEQIFP